MKLFNVAKLVFIGIAVVSAVGCSSFQPSTYTNYNTPYGNVIQATGKSADNAGLANTSYNCPSCAVSGGSSRGGSSIRNYRNDQDFMSKITSSALNTLSGSISREINSTIRENVNDY